ncbi:MAG TPA: hypothetical protein VFF16_06955, partial [Telluria sp.]|nr:hypothetical protein [Telluria sp.]
EARAQLADALRTADQRIAILAAARADTAAAHEAAAAACELAGQTRNAHQTALREIDEEALRARHARLLAERDALRTGAQRLEAWQQAVAQAEQGRLRVEQLLAEAAQTDALLAAANAADPAVRAAHAQADQALAAARLACAASVEELRAHLHDGEACPVCGSIDHPYQGRDAALQAVLGELEAQLTRAADALAANVAEKARHGAAWAAQQRQLEELRAAQTTLDAKAADTQAAWEADPHAAAAEPAARDLFTPETETPGAAQWFAARLAENETSLHACAERQNQALALRSAWETAQRDYEAAAAALEQLRGKAQSAADDATRANSESTLMKDRHASQAAALAGLLAELDGAMPSAAWQSEWERAPADFLEARRQEVHAWTTRAAERAEDERAQAALVPDLAAAAERVQATAQASEAARTALDRAEAGQKEAQRLRAGSLDGRSVADVERSLQAAIRESRLALQARQRAAADAALALGNARTALGHAQSAALATGQAHARAAAALDDWCANFGALDRAALASLLVHDHAWIGAERAALEALERAAAAASTVLDERRARRAQHQHTRPPTLPENPEALASALAQAAELCRSLNDAVLEQRVHLKQDDERRAATSTIQQQLSAQQEEERRWARLDELIGSADGKRFRNYAQQYTLDVLLGYANHHLRQLARRYRLERIATASGPSLGLMVR